MTFRKGVEETNVCGCAQKLCIVTFKALGVDDRFFLFLKESDFF